MAKRATVKISRVALGIAMAKKASKVVYDRIRGMAAMGR